VRILPCETACGIIACFHMGHEGRKGIHSNMVHEFHLIRNEIKIVSEVLKRLKSFHVSYAIFLVAEALARNVA